MDRRFILYIDKTTTAAEPFEESTAEAIPCHHFLLPCAVKRKFQTDFHDKSCQETAAKQHDDNLVVWFAFVNDSGLTM